MNVRLVKYEAARAALAEAHRIDEVKDIRDKAQAMAAYAKQARDTEMIEKATEIKVRAERRCGELLMDTAARGERATKNGNVNPATAKVSDDATPCPPTLADMGLTRDESSRYQRLAAMPEEHFEAAVETAKATVGEVTSAHMLRLAAELRATREVEEMLAKASAERDTRSIAAEAWGPIRSALLLLHRRIEESRSLPECPDHVKEELLSMWRAVSLFLSATFTEAKQ